ncbi:MAG: 4-hydroxythreonine-4-phosphate dehydrogenase PdxA [Clostridiales bacterium]|nr:4-hydroxythreonine-4-phosphate dehydrogenase PdxA [Clostridiales bacterium]
MTLPKVGITLGDPGGIGPEIVVKAFSGRYPLPRARYILFGSGQIIKREEKALGFSLPLRAWRSGLESAQASLSLREVPAPFQGLVRGAPAQGNGKASFRFFEAAIAEARRGNLQAVVTAPISKKSWELAGIRWKGHTDYLNHYYPDAIMAFWSRKLKVALFSHHLSLKEALKRVRRRNLLRFFLILHQSLEKIRPGGLELVVSGLNPHAGEDGLLGREELDEIIPAIKGAQKLGLQISGPFPPDVVFRSTLGQEDKIVVALYHDQGLIPFKLQALGVGVNVSLGLPFVRTSPDHGTAFDIAGKKTASPRSFVEAIKLAVALTATS